jgi:hypothetical protein
MVVAAWMVLLIGLGAAAAALHKATDNSSTSRAPSRSAHWIC